MIAGIATFVFLLFVGGLLLVRFRKREFHKKALEKALETTPKKSNAEIVREIINQALATGLEILFLIELMEVQNSGGINKNLTDAGLGNAAFILRNSLMTRLVLLVSREYSKSKDTDRNLHRAFDLLKRDQILREIFSKDLDGIDAADAHFQRCKGDHRYQKIRHFRDKFTAHIGEPENVPLPPYKELFAFARETVDCIDEIAIATGLADVKVKNNNDAKDQASSFWEPWRKKAFAG